MNERKLTVKGHWGGCQLWKGELYRPIPGNTEKTNNLIGPQTTFYRTWNSRSMQSEYVTESSHELTDGHIEHSFVSNVDYISLQCWFDSRSFEKIVLQT